MVQNLCLRVKSPHLDGEIPSVHGLILFNPWLHRELPPFPIAPSPEVWAMKRRVAPSGAQVPMGGLAPPNQQDMQTTLLTEPQGMGRWSPYVAMAQNTRGLPSGNLT